MKLEINGWRLIPKVEFIDWREHPLYNKHTYSSWFLFQRMWGGKLVYITIKHYQLCFDFRANWLNDMMPKGKAK